jgi:hypothetical protein
MPETESKGSSRRSSTSSSFEGATGLVRSQSFRRGEALARFRRAVEAVLRTFKVVHKLEYKTVEGYKLPSGQDLRMV